MKNKTRNRDGSAGFRDRRGVGAQIFHSLPDFILANGDDVVYILLDQREVDRSHTLRAQPIGNSARNLLSRELNDFARAKTGLRI